MGQGSIHGPSIRQSYVLGGNHRSRYPPEKEGSDPSVFLETKSLRAGASGPSYD